MEQQITKISAEVLKVHPRNQEFYDDIEGKDYETFKNSIKEEGIITPLIIAPDMIIVSGHQRLKAAKDLGIKQVPVIIREDLDDEDEKLKKLLASNFGRLKNDEAKQRKIVAQYVKLCGYNHGGNRKSSRNNCGLIPKSEIAKEFGISERQLDYILDIEHKLTPEIKELLNTGIISKTSASMIWTRLSLKEQNELLEELGKDKIEEMTQQQLKQYINENKEQQEELQDKIDELQTKLDKTNIDELIIEKQEAQLKERTTYEELQKIKKEKEKIENEKKEIIKEKQKIEIQIEELKNQEPEKIIIKEEVVSDEVKIKLIRLNNLEKEFKEKNIEIKSNEKKLEEAEKKIAELIPFRERAKEKKDYFSKFLLSLKDFISENDKLNEALIKNREKIEDVRADIKEQCIEQVTILDEFINQVKLILY